MYRYADIGRITYRTRTAFKTSNNTDKSLYHKVTLGFFKKLINLNGKHLQPRVLKGNSNKAQEANLHMEMEKQYRFINNNNDNEEHLIRSYAPYGYVYSQESTVI